MIKLPRASILYILKQYYFSNFIKYHSRQAIARNLVYLEHRSLIQLTNNDVLPFLQGLTTNDMRHFDEGAVSMYSILLNTKGRVLFDIIIYKVQEQGLFYIECDSTVLINLIKHLQLYKLRKNVNIKSMENSMKVWSVYDTNIIYQNYCNLQNNHNFEGKLLPCGMNNYKYHKFIDNILICNDPRIFELGFRILTESNITHTELINYLGPNISIVKDISDYRSFRYKLGIGEGVQDLLFGVSFPLEINCDYLHGVSFHKGCYIGQELTARTHHTGVIRKRLMPLIFNNINGRNFEYDEKIVNDNGNIVGKIRGYVGTVGLGLMRIAETIASKTLFVKGCTLKIVKPQWWPQESPKIGSLKINKH